MAKTNDLKICSYDVIQNKTHKASSVYKYFQQVAREDLDALGLTYDILFERGIVFVLVKMKSKFYKPLFVDDEITVDTCHRKTKGASFIRDYLIKKDGEIVGETSSYWVLMDVNTRHMCRPSVLDSELNTPVELCSFEIDDRFSFPQDVEPLTYSYKVVFSDLDQNRHMNNTRYPDICFDALGDVFEEKFVSDIRLDYIAEAKIGDELELTYAYCPDDETYYFCAYNKTADSRCFDAKIKLANL